MVTCHGCYREIEGEGKACSHFEEEAILWEFKCDCGNIECRTSEKGSHAETLKCPYCNQITTVDIEDTWPWEALPECTHCNEQFVKD